MLVGKKFLMNVRALRFVVIELLFGFIDNIKDQNEFDLLLKRISEESVLSEHWLKNLMHTFLLMLQYIRAEREGEFPFHLYACKKRFHIYFLAAGARNYVKDGIYYLRSMEKFSGDILNKFMKGEHVMSIKKGYGIEYGQI